MKPDQVLSGYRSKVFKFFLSLMHCFLQIIHHDTNRLPLDLIIPDTKDRAGPYLVFLAMECCIDNVLNKNKPTTTAVQQILYSRFKLLSQAPKYFTEIRFLMNCAFGPKAGINVTLVQVWIINPCGENMYRHILYTCTYVKSL